MNFAQNRWGWIVLLAALIFFLLISVAALSTRSIWSDEAMLLRNIYGVGMQEFLQPLPYYDQAAPFLSLVIIKSISLIVGINFELFRVSIFFVVAICAIPVLARVAHTGSKPLVLAFLLICSANVYNFLFYATEIKHYAFEMAGVFIFLFWLDIYIENREVALNTRLLWLPILTIFLGFSTLLLVPAFLLFVLVDSIFQKEEVMSSKVLIVSHIRFAIVLLITIIIAYSHMKYLTVSQLANSWSQEIYGSRGLLDDIVMLGKAAVGAYYKPFFVITACSSVIAFMMERKSRAFKFNIFFLATVLVVVTLKVLGLYPVIYPRHLIWLIPVSMLTTTILISELLRSKKKVHRILLASIVLMLLIPIGRNIYKVNSGFYAGSSNNDALYSKLANYPASDVLVVDYALPSLEIYQMKYEGLSKHRYIGIAPNANLSSVKKLVKEEDFTDWQFSQLPQSKSFLLILSHCPHIDEEPTDHKTILALRNTLGKNNCAYHSTFKAEYVQILKVSCETQGNKI